jgi:hypothetical protein
VEIYTCTFKSNTASGVSGLLTAYRIFLNFPPIPGVGHPTQQGGAIEADNGADVKIYTSTFESNTASWVSG